MYYPCTDPVLTMYYPITVADSKMRDFSAQNQQLQENICQAAHYIAELERLLQSQQYGSISYGPNFSLDEPPPDVC